MAKNVIIGWIKKVGLIALGGGGGGGGGASWIEGTGMCVLNYTTSINNFHLLSYQVVKAEN